MRPETHRGEIDTKGLGWELAKNNRNYYFRLFFFQEKNGGPKAGWAISFKTVSILKMRAEDLAVWDFVEFCESIGFSLFFLIR